MKEIMIKYFNEYIKNNPGFQIKKVENGDWIDLRVVDAVVTRNDGAMIREAIKSKATHDWINGTISYDAGRVIVMRLGVAMELPSGYKANIYPRSSTFPTYGLILTNSVGCIDFKYRGDTDEWLAIFYATRGGHITQFDRVCQFEITEQMPEIEFITVNSLRGDNRGGHGTSGTK